MKDYESLPQWAQLLVSEFGIALTTTEAETWEQELERTNDGPEITMAELIDAVRLGASQEAKKGLLFRRRPTRSDLASWLWEIRRRNAPEGPVQACGFCGTYRSREATGWISVTYISRKPGEIVVVSGRDCPETEGLPPHQIQTASFPCICKRGKEASSKYTEDDMVKLRKIQRDYIDMLHEQKRR